MVPGSAGTTAACRESHFPKVLEDIVHMTAAMPNIAVRVSLALRLQPRSEQMPCIGRASLDPEKQLGTQNAGAYLSLIHSIGDSRKSSLASARI